MLVCVFGGGGGVVPLRFPDRRLPNLQVAYCVLLQLIASSFRVLPVIEVAAEADDLGLGELPQ